MERFTVKRYSEAFKRQVVREYEDGASASFLQKKYGIGGWETISRWIKHYGRYGFRHELVRIQTMDEQNRLKELEAENEQLRAALAQLTLDKLMLETTLEVIEEDYGIDAKKNERTSLRERTAKESTASA